MLIQTLTVLAAGALGYFIGRTDGALSERTRVAKLLASLSGEADREHGKKYDV